MDISKFLDDGYSEGFGLTRDEAWKQGVCVQCKQEVHAGPAGEKGAVYSDAGAKEYSKNSAMCETCFDDVRGGSMSTVRGVVVTVLDNGNGETTITYEYEPPSGMQNVTINTADVPEGLGFGDVIEVTYNYPNLPTIKIAERRTMSGNFGGGGKMRPRGPYGTNEGDIWSGEDSEVGRMLMERDGLVMIHEVLEKDGKVEEGIYNVDKDNPDPEMQDLIERARKGTELWIAAQAANN